VKGKRILYPVKSKRAELENLQLLRVEINSQHTKIDFGYTSTDYYERGGWVHINKKTFVSVHGIQKEFALLKAENIPFAPNQLSFKTSNDWLFFSLYFEAIPFNSKLIDLIENADDKNSFNFYKIPLEDGMEIF
jgi:hypothetical protein